MRILIADDDPGWLLFLRVVLTRLGYVVETAADGCAAWEKMQAQPPHLALLDWMMPVGA